MLIETILNSTMWKLLGIIVTIWTLIDLIKKNKVEPQNNTIKILLIGIACIFFLGLTISQFSIKWVYQEVNIILSVIALLSLFSLAIWINIQKTQKINLFSTNFILLIFNQIKKSIYFWFIFLIFLNLFIIKFNQFQERSHVIIKKNVIIDTNSNLVWQIASPGSSTWEKALQYAQKMKKEKLYGFENWKLPNKSQLIELSKFCKINPGYLKHDDKWYWTSNEQSASFAWVVNHGWAELQFDDFDEHEKFTKKNHTHYIRLVSPINKSLE